MMIREQDLITAILLATGIIFGLFIGMLTAIIILATIIIK